MRRTRQEGYRSAGRDAPRCRQAAGRDRGAVRGPLAGAALLRLRHGFRPNVDSFHTDDPHALTVVVELPGVDPQSVASSSASARSSSPASASARRSAGRVYQQMEIEYGPFQRQVRLRRGRRPRASARAASSTASLTVELPVADQAPAAGPRSRSRCGAHDRRRLRDCRSESPTQSSCYPAALPVLPLKETVVFPQSMTPLAIGQERSVRLIDDVVAGDRLLALVTVARRRRSRRRAGTTSTRSARSRSSTR